MKKSVFSVDGVEFPTVHVMSLKRSFQVVDGTNAGRTMDGKMQRDIIGTYYNYSAVVTSDFKETAEYDALYEAITSPQDSHTIVMPYGQATLTFQAYVTNGDDELTHMFDDLNRWDKLTFNFIAMKPQRSVL